MIADNPEHDLSGAAGMLGVDPFELVRLAVMSNNQPTRWQFSNEQLESLTRFGGIEHWFRDLEPQPADGDAWLQASLSRWLDVDGPTRVDNLWRDVPAPARAHLQSTIEQLVDLGYLSASVSAQGTMVMVAEPHADAVRDLAAGRTRASELASA